MISIAILYSPDRLPQLQNTIGCLEDMEGYEECEVVLAVDGPINIRPPGWNVIRIKRPGTYYCWATALNTAVEHCQNEVIWYIDSDRVVPTGYLEPIKDLTKDDVFVYPKQLYSIREDVSLERLRFIRDNINDCQSLLHADHRTTNPENIHSKNVFSGCVSFTKSTFNRLGGFDERYQGWGYPDFDLLMNAKTNGCEFVGIDCQELHQHHSHGPDKKFRLMNLWNCYQYLKKWNLKVPDHIEKNVASNRVREYKTMSEFLSSEFN